MSKQSKIMIVVLSVLGALVLYNVWFFMKKKPDRAASKTRTERTERKKDRETAGRNEPAATEPRILAMPPVRDNWGPNPFLLSIEEQTGKTYASILNERKKNEKPVETVDLEELEAALKELSLEAIIHDPRHPLAVVDHEFFREGDRLPGGRFEIRKIHPDHVLVVAEGTDLTLPLKSD